MSTMLFQNKEWLFAALAFAALGTAFHIIISQRSPLGRKALGCDANIDAMLSNIGATGVDCITYLQTSFNHKPFKLTLTHKTTGGSFCFFRRQMTISKSLNEPSLRSVITGAHEFVHTLQTDGFWYFCHIISLISLLFLFAALILTALKGINSWTFLLIIAFIATFNATKTSEEIHATITSLALSKLYLKHKNITMKLLDDIIAEAENKICATAISYLLTHFAISFYLSTLAILIPVLLQLLLLNTNLLIGPLLR